MNTLCTMASYSAYLNMRSCSIWTYFLILFVALTFGVLEFFEDASPSGRRGNIQLLAKIVVCCCYLIFSLYGWPLFRTFQKAGGVTGLDDTENLTADKIHNIFKKSTNYVMKKSAKIIDDQHKKTTAKEMQAIDSFEKQ